jgi:glucose dehydrogenase
VDGAHRKVLMQEPRNGFSQVLDRQTGKLIFRGQRCVSGADAPVDTLLRVEANG